MLNRNSRKVSHRLTYRFLIHLRDRHRLHSLVTGRISGDSVRDTLAPDTAKMREMHALLLQRDYPSTRLVSAYGVIAKYRALFDRHDRNGATRVKNLSRQTSAAH